MGLALENLGQIEACVVTQDVQKFAGLQPLLEASVCLQWGAISFADALALLKTPEGSALQFLTLAIRAADEPELPNIARIIALAKKQKTRIILVVDSVSTATLHVLMQQGADGFLPYPIPDGALGELVSKFSRPSGPTLVVSNQTGQISRNGMILPVYGVAGGVGATTIAINLAWEMAQLGQKNGFRTLVLDLELQFGTVSTYLDLERREAIFELLSDMGAMDRDAFSAAVQQCGDQLDVFTAPAESLPLEILESADIERLLDLARCVYDFVIIDMPSTLVSWAETLVNRADVILAVLGPDMRSSRNTMRFIEMLESEELPLDKVKFLLNRAPKAKDIRAHRRLKRMAENVGFEYCSMLADGGGQVLKACDSGLPLAELARKNPLRKGILKLADQLLARRQARVSAGA